MIIPELEEALRSDRDWSFRIHAAAALAELDKSYKEYARDLIYEEFYGGDIGKMILQCSQDPDEIDCSFAISRLFRLRYDPAKVIKLLDVLMVCENHMPMYYYLGSMKFSMDRWKETPEAIGLIERARDCGDSLLKEDAERILRRLSKEN